MLGNRSRVGLLAFLTGCWLAAAPGSARAAGPARQAAAHPAAATSSPVRPVLEQYCQGCHNQRLRTAGLALDTADAEHVGADAAVWEKVIRRLRAGTMPPAGRPRPGQSTVDAVVARLETELDTFAAAHPNPGRFAPVRRLNRFEYQSAVSDLLGLEMDLSDLLPMDNTSDEGFDNYVSQLSVSPLLVERYLTAARRISAAAVGIAPEGPTVERHDVHLNLIQNERMSEDLPFGSQGGVAVRHHFPADGEYRIGIRLQRNYNDYIRGMGRPHDLDVRVNGVLVKRFTIGGEDHGTPAPSGYGGNIQMGTEWEHYIHHADDNLAVTFAARAGPQVIGLSFARDRIEPERIPQPRPWGFALATNEFPFGHMSVSRFDITGPLHPGGRGTTPSRARLFVCEPRRSEDEAPCARTILSTLARRAYRRPIGEADLEPLLAAYAAARRAGDFDRGIQNAVRTLLADPKFLLRIERAPTGAAHGGLEPVTDLELASRLSFFLWSSVPDDELLDLAVRGTLSRPAVLERQVRRLLADRRSTRSLVDSFAAQWLQLRMLEDVFRDPEIFPEFDENLRNGFEQETKRFVAHTLREDASVLDLLRADYTFLNERLARHYGVPNVYGERLRRVELPADSPRGGLLGHGSILTVTSYANRTSPVIRGKWLMQTILGMGPPPPPDDVPALPERGGGSVPVSVRARLEQHRENPVCAACHAPMDPLGFALENFDGIGMWRATEEGTAIDASGVTPDGARFEGLKELRDVLLRQPERFAGAVVEKLLAFSLGRALEHYDRPAVRKGREMNSIAKRTLPRRTVLRGVGATLALPLLDAMVPALTPTVRTAAKPIRRFGAVYVPNGMAMDYWTPAAVGSSFELMPINASLAPFRNRLVMVSGLKLPWDAPHPSAPFLSGAVGNPGENDIACGVTMDQIVAREFGRQTQLASLELAIENVGNTGQCSGGYSCVYSNMISWRDATTPLPMENNPRLVFERMFGESTSTGAVARRERLAEDNSVLDAVLDSLARLRREIGAGDRDRVDQYVESVRDVERRLRIAERQATDELPLLERPAGIPPSYGEHARLMFDLQLLAYQTDLTRVVTFMMAREQSSLTYSEIGVPDSHHPLSHHAHQPARVATMARINAYHCGLFADYVARLAATPDGDGTLLDHVMIVYGSGISDSMEHVKDNLPIVLVGGGAGTIRGGRHLDYGGGNRSDWDTDGRGVKADVPPLSNLCLTLMDKLGVPVDRLGDSTGPLDIDAEVSL